MTRINGLMGLCLLALIAVAAYAGDSVASGSTFPKEQVATDPAPRPASQNAGLMILAKGLGEEAAEEEEWAEWEEDLRPIEKIPDPLERYNRFMFGFNDKVYFYGLKPVAKVYGAILPVQARLCVQNFFLNIYSPVRFVNCALQGDGKGFCNESSRFVINTTVGVGGLFDPAESWLNLEMKEEYLEDFGQTLGRFKGPGFYLNNPFKGPSSLRDFAGGIVDLFIVPSYYVLSNYSYYFTAAQALEIINKTSLTLGEYEEMKRSVLDPYISVRDAYQQYREALIAK